MCFKNVRIAHRGKGCIIIVDNTSGAGFSIVDIAVCKQEVPAHFVFEFVYV